MMSGSSSNLSLMSFIILAIIIPPRLHSDNSFPRTSTHLPRSSRTVTIIRIPHDNNRTNTVVNTIITNRAKLPIAPSLLLSSKPSAPHDHRAQIQPLDLQTQPLPHVVVLHYLDLVREPRLLQGLREIGDFRGREGVEILLGGVARRRRRLEREGAPVGAEEDGGGGDVEDDDGVSGADVVIDGPADGEGAFLREVDCDSDFTAGAGGGGCGGGSGGVVVVGVARGGRVMDLDGGEVGVIGGIWVHVSSLSLLLPI